MRGYRSPLGGLQADRPDPEAVKRAGWQGQRILVVALDDVRLDGFQREFVKQIGELLYGNHSTGSTGPLSGQGSTDSTASSARRGRRSARTQGGQHHV